MSVPSNLLTQNENLILQELLRQKEQLSLSTAVARLHLTQAQTNHKLWIPIVTGVICFIKDYSRRSHYIVVTFTLTYVHYIYYTFLLIRT